jgi:hypothetical protein
MNLKDAFRYQNFLDRMLVETYRYLGDSSNVTKTTQEHQRHKANKEAEDETVEITTGSKTKYAVSNVVDFMLELLDEKSELCKAITAAKSSSGEDIDALIAVNKAKQAVSRTLVTLGDTRSAERVVRGSGYKFNATGEQVSYYYDIKEVSTIDFDRNVIKKLGKKLKADADEVSSLVDQLMVNLQVEILPAFDVNDTFEDSMERFLNAA